MLVAVAVCLIALILWRFFVPAHEVPPGSVAIDIAFDAILVAVLVGARVALAQTPPADGLRMSSALFWVGLAAGLGLFVIRFGGGEESWYTGHRLFVVLPRTW
jgi:hypothetical protein